MMTLTTVLLVVGYIMAWCTGFGCAFIIEWISDEMDRRRRKEYESYLGATSDEEWKRLTS